LPPGGVFAQRSKQCGRGSAEFKDFRRDVFRGFAGIDSPFGIDLVSGHHSL
jgi:hypothetical protein